MSDDTVEFQGGIEVRRWKQGGRWIVVMSMEGQSIEMDLEETAVLTYQLQTALKDIQEMSQPKE